MHSFKRFSTLLFAMTALICAGALADVTLPAPQVTGGKGIFESLKGRQSADLNTFPQKALSLQELSTILWAGTGLNRADGWTTPYGMHSSPYVSLYVASDKGISRYDWKAQALKPVSTANVISQLGKQPAVAKAPVVLIIVAEYDSMPKRIDAATGRDWAHIAAGAVSQNIYLAAASLNIGTRYIVSMNSDVITRELKLTSSQAPLAILPLGKY